MKGNRRGIGGIGGMGGAENTKTTSWTTELTFNAGRCLMVYTHARTWSTCAIIINQSIFIYTALVQKNSKVLSQLMVKPLKKEQVNKMDEIKPNKIIKVSKIR